MGALTPVGRVDPGCGGVFAPVGPAAEPQAWSIWQRPNHEATLSPGPRAESRQVSLVHDSEPSSPSVSNHLLPSRSAHLERAAPGRHHPGFAGHSRARQDSRPNRVCL